MVPVTAGVALSFQLRAARDPSRVALTWIGDGALKTGAAHEGLNLAAVRRLPAIFILQNNQVALGTRVAQSHLGGDYARVPESYGIRGAAFDGNNVLDAYAATWLAAERCRRGEGPVMLVATTFRMSGHATHDEADGRRVLDPALHARWGARDPVALYEEHLTERGVDRRLLEAVEREVTAEVDAAEQAALASREGRMPAGPEALAGV
jgi:TPP-dependent pyruvate/acetoin dehydrogenase alpha subunit